jgi:hypothetical protein
MAKRLGFQAKEEEGLQGMQQQLNTNVRAKADASEAPRLQCQACQGCRSRSVTIILLKHYIFIEDFNLYYSL